MVQVIHLYSNKMWWILLSQFLRFEIFEAFLMTFSFTFFLCSGACASIVGPLISKWYVMGLFQWGPIHSWVLCATFLHITLIVVLGSQAPHKWTKSCIRANGFLIRKPTSKMLQLTTYMLSVWIVHSVGSDINYYEHKFFFLLTTLRKTRPSSSMMKCTTSRESIPPMRKFSQ